MCKLFEDFELNLQERSRYSTKKIAVGLSGGCDSMALIFLLKDFCQKNDIELFAVTVDHKIRQNSAKEALEIGKVLKSHNISHQILEIEQVPDANIEANLRQKRYELLLDFCNKNQIEHLFLGHHIGDVAENFLIRLFRGSGLDGLSTMSDNLKLNNVQIMRPLLDFDKKDLKNYLKEKNITWFEDETNEDEKFLRNKIRKFLETFEEKDQIHSRIKKTSDEISEIRDIFDEKLLKESKNCLKFNNSGYFLMNSEKFKNIEEKTALKILALVLMEVGGKIYKPRLEKLKNFYSYVIESELSAIKPKNFYGCMLKKYDDKNLIIFKEFLDEDLEKKILKKEKITIKNPLKLKTILSQIF